MRVCLALLFLLLMPLRTLCPASTQVSLPAPPALPLSIRMDYALNPSLPSGPTQILIAVLEPHAGYYTYAHHSDAPRPTQVGLIVNGQPLATDVRYPLGTPHPDAFTGKNVPAYTGPVSVFLTLPDTAGDLELHVSLLLCSASNCTPVDETLPLPPVPGATALSDINATPWAESWKAAVPGFSLMDAPLPAHSPGRTPGSASAAGPAGSVPLRSLPSLPAESAQPLPLLSLPGTNAAPTPGWVFTPRQPDTAADPATLGAAIGWGLLAGLILNIMPCVLPVLTLKMFALLGPAGSACTADRLRLFREHNLLFAAGVLTWFSLLAGAVSLMGMTWGGLFQYAGAVAVLAGLTGLLSLSMLDLCTLPIIDLKLSAPSGSPRSQAYLTGLTATLLATPCSGPLLGGVLAWSAAQPPIIVLIVFLSTGCGMALPYLLLAVWPSAVALLPRPGRWLSWLERGAGMFLLATTLWLLTLLPLVGALLLAAGLIVLALILIVHRARRTGKLGVALALTLICALPGLWILSGPARIASAPQTVWETFSPALLSSTLGKEAILLEFTADWCPNCKALEATTLSPARLLDWRKRYAVRLIKVDMTTRDPAREALLRALGSISIPLTAVFPPGEGARSPIVLRDLYTPASLENVLSSLPGAKERP